MLIELYYDDYLQNKILVIVYTDTQSLHDNLHLTKQVKENRLQITQAGIQESSEKGNIKKIMEIPSKCQLPDCLTKKGALHECLMYRLKVVCKMWTDGLWIMDQGCGSDPGPTILCMTTSLLTS